MSNNSSHYDDGFKARMSGSNVAVKDKYLPGITGSMISHPFGPKFGNNTWHNNEITNSSNDKEKDKVLGADWSVFVSGSNKEIYVSTRAQDGSFDSITVRCDTPGGLRTEFKKRREQILSGELSASDNNHYTLHCYGEGKVEKPAAVKPKKAFLVNTFQLIEYIVTHDVETGENGDDGNEFYKVWISNLLRAGIVVYCWVYGPKGITMIDLSKYDPMQAGIKIYQAQQRLE